VTADRPAVPQYTPRPRISLDELFHVADLAWAAVAANYATSGLDILDKGPLWDAIADVEFALRRIGYGR